mgnify:CR=1 FL=1
MKRSLLHYAARGGSVLAVKFLVIDKKCSMFEKDRYGNTALHMAAIYGSSNAADWLLTYQAEEIRMLGTKDSFMDFVREMFVRMMRERISKHRLQIFPKKWMKDACKKVR